MKTKLMALVFVVVILSSMGLVSAITFYHTSGVPIKQIRLFMKDPATWIRYDKLGIGYLQYYPEGEEFFYHLIAYKLAPDTEYTLIYYGDETHNDVWPYATCIGVGTSNYFGKLLMAGYYDFGYDLVDAKIWLVTSTDVDCDAGRMIAWNPTDYLFENNLIIYTDTNK